MEKTNWIEKIKKAIRVAINKGLKINSYDYGNNNNQIVIDLTNDSYIEFFMCNDRIVLNTPKGKNTINYSFTDREKLEIQDLVLSIKEYKEDMAISELDEFISDKKDEITDINNLDDDD